MKSTSEIQAVAIYKVTVKESGKQCFAVPSDSNPNLYYTTCFDEKSASWTCTCPAGQFGRHTCKHARAAQQSIIANKAAKAEQKPAEQELHSCDTCWRQIKPEFTTCSVCLGY